MLRFALAATIALALSTAARAEPPKGATYKIDAPQALKVKKGAQATARLTVVPRADSHVSPDAPVSVAVTGSPTLYVPTAKLGRAEAKETPQKGVAFEIPFTAKEAGAGTLGADMVFFICTEQLCERHKEHVQLAVQAE